MLYQCKPKIITDRSISLLTKSSSISISVEGGGGQDDKQRGWSWSLPTAMHLYISNHTRFRYRTINCEDNPGIKVPLQYTWRSQRGEVKVLSWEQQFHRTSALTSTHLICSMHVLLPIMNEQHYCIAWAITTMTMQRQHSKCRRIGFIISLAEKWLFEEESAGFRLWRITLRIAGIVDFPSSGILNNQKTRDWGYPYLTDQTEQVFTSPTWTRKQMQFPKRRFLVRIQGSVQSFDARHWRHSCF
jgi:hypothetical protein